MVSVGPVSGDISLITGLRGRRPGFPTVTLNKYFVPKLMNEGDFMGRYTETMQLLLVLASLDDPWPNQVLRGWLPSDDFNFITSVFISEHSLPTYPYISTWTGGLLYDSVGCNCYCGH